MSLAARGLLVCNHLGYLDILVLAACRPALFVAKSEVKQWPVFGWFARLAGTIFVHRGKPLQAAQSADQIALALWPTADGVRELQNRRVEITYGPGSGN